MANKKGEIQGSCVSDVVMRAAMMYGSETGGFGFGQEAEAELEMLRCSFITIRTDRVRNEQIRGAAEVQQFRDKVSETRMK